MSDVPASVPPGDDPKPTEATKEPAEASTEGEADESWGWDAEISDADEELGISEETPDAPRESVTDNSVDDTPQPSEDEAPTQAPPPAAPVMPLPPGFKDWNEVLAAAQSAVRQAPPTKPKFPGLPHDDDPAVRRLAEQVLNAPLEQRAQILQAAPGELGARVAQRLHATEEALLRLRSDPYAFVKEAADAMAREAMESSVFADRFRKLEDVVYRQRGQQFLQEHKLSSAEQADLASLLSDGVKPERAVQIVVQQRELRNLKGREGRVSSQQRQIEANKAASRAQQAGKGRGRVPDTTLKAEFKAAGTDVVKLAKLAERQLRERGQ